ncbi:MAG: hypothetical protein R2877_02355 [Bdellovibrionota bacterium]
MFKKITPKEWVQLLIAIFIVAWMGYFFPLGLEKHIYNATQGEHFQNSFLALI